MTFDQRPHTDMISSPSGARADNDCQGLLIIDQGPLIKYNTHITNHVITIISLWLSIHYDISTVISWV